MTDAQLAGMARGLAPVLKEAIAAATAPLLLRIAALEAREIRDGRDGRDGLSIQGPPGERGPIGETGPSGPQGEKGEPGLTGPGGERGSDGTDGSPGPPGPVGPPGEKGLDGTNGINGTDGRDGKDGATLGPEDLISLSIDPDTRTGTFVFRRSDTDATLTFDVPGLMLYRDVWKPDTVYERGDCTTWGGSLWIAKAQTSAKPGLPTEDSRAWKLCVKAGRDGKTGAEGPKGKDGEPGRDGKDLTQMDQAGRKW